MSKSDVIFQYVTGYHGTDAACADSVMGKNFNESKGKYHWLGDGVYFFTKGISVSPSDDARKWAVAQAWNADKKKYDHTHYVVLSSEIRLFKLWDLTTEDGMRIFNYARQEILKKIREKGRPSEKYFDSTVINYVKKQLDYQVIKANFYIKFTFERMNRIYSRIPNTTILAVSDSANNIDKDSIRIEERGKIQS